MSAKTTSLLLLAAIGLAACDNDNSPAAVTPTPPADETPVIDNSQSVEVQTRANAIADFSLDAENAVVVNASNLALRNQQLVDERAGAANINDRINQLVVLGTSIGENGIPDTDAVTIQAIADEINTYFGEIVIDAATNETGDAYVARVMMFVEMDGGINDRLETRDINAVANVDNAQMAFDQSREQFAADAVLNEREGDPITLADGTILQTAGAAIYTRVDENTTDETVLTPTASVIVAYETDENGDPRSVAFYEAGGIAFEGAPVGTAFFDGSGTSYAFMEVADLGSIAMGGNSQLMLDFNDASGSFGAQMGGNNMNGGALVAITADLMFNRQTGEFTTSTGSVVAGYTPNDGNLEFATTNDLTLNGGLRGLAEAYSGTFQVNGADISGDGAFIGAPGSDSSGFDLNLQ